ncbi:MAG: hypothetical protein GXO63_01155 [Candidatus Micrarchaeota archaeon]|nr:hypothetical protein [Candidatus Micrarchaeota archaeon]
MKPEIKTKIETKEVVPSVLKKNSGVYIESRSGGLPGIVLAKTEEKNLGIYRIKTIVLILIETGVDRESIKPDSLKAIKTKMFRTFCMRFIRWGEYDFDSLNMEKGVREVISSVGIDVDHEFLDSVISIEKIISGKTYIGFALPNQKKYSKSISTRKLFLRVSILQLLYENPENRGMDIRLDLSYRDQNSCNYGFPLGGATRT